MAPDSTPTTDAWDRRWRVNRRSSVTRAAAADLGRAARPFIHDQLAEVREIPEFLLARWAVGPARVWRALAA